jgi:hypothetical protein
MTEWCARWRALHIAEERCNASPPPAKSPAALATGLSSQVTSGTGALLLEPGSQIDPHVVDARKERGAWSDLQAAFGVVDGDGVNTNP